MGPCALLERAPGIRWISEPDRGRVHAANKGVHMATGDVVAWLNADDRYEPGTLRAVGEAFTREPRRGVGHRLLPHHRRRRCGDPQPDHGLQEPAPPALVAAALPDSELRVRPRNLRAAGRSTRGGTARRALPHVARLRPMAPCGRALRPAGDPPEGAGVLSNDRDHAQHGRLRAAVPRARRDRAGVRPAAIRSLSPSTAR